MPTHLENHGIAPGPQQRPSDFVAGVFTPITYEVRNPSGDWRPFLVERENQFGLQDSMSCVSFSAVSAIEMQEKFLTGVERNYSDRWIAKMSNTTPQGNWLYKVAEAIEEVGLVRELSYPAPPNYTFDQYHAPIMTEVLTKLIAEGARWNQQWQFKAEFIPATKEAMLKHIKHAPLQIVIPGHAVVEFLCEADIVRYFDTYPPHEKTTPYSNIQAVMKPLLTRKPMIKRYKVNDHGKLGILTIPDGSFSDPILWAKNQEHYEFLLKFYEIPDNAPTVSFPEV